MYIHTYIRKSEAAKGTHSNQNKPERNQWECVSVRVCVKQDIENIIVAVKLNTHTRTHSYICTSYMAYLPVEYSAE